MFDSSHKLESYLIVSCCHKMCVAKSYELLQIGGVKRTMIEGNIPFIFRFILTSTTSNSQN
jgi:hypothetical protein